MRRWILASALSAAAHLNSTAATADVPGCYMNIPRNARTIAYGVYTGGAKSAVQMASSHQTKQVTVAVPKGEQPVFLVLSAYDPVYWNLDIEDGAELSGAVVFSYHGQAVGNVPPFVPVGFSTVEHGRGPDCPKPIYSYGEGDNYAAFETLISDEFGKAIDEFHGAYSAEVLPKSHKKPVAEEPGFWTWLTSLIKPEPAKHIIEIRSSAALRPQG